MSTWLAVLVAHSLLLALVLAGHGRRRDPANGLLAAFVASAGVLLFESWIGYSGVAMRAPHWLGVFRPAWFAIGPLGYLYVRRSCGVPAARRELLLAAPAVVVFAAHLPFYFSAADGKATRYFAASSSGTVMLFLAFSIVTGACAWASSRELKTACAATAASFERESPRREPWLRLLMRLLMAYVLVDLVATVWFVARGSYPEVVAMASLFVLVSLIYAIGYLVILPDGLLARAARVAEWSGVAARTELSPGRARVLVERLGRLMQEEELWRDEDLRLDQVAERLGISRHHLSELFNQHLDTTFREYLNMRRVAEVQRRLLDESRSGSLLDTALESGFGSSASFYRAFRKHVGCTPRQFVDNATGGGRAEGAAVVVR